MALPEVEKTKNARYLISYKATQKSMRPDRIHILYPYGTGDVEGLGTNIGKKKKKVLVVSKLKLNLKRFGEFSIKKSFRLQNMTVTTYLN